jgi:hypothetical protein
MTSPAQSEPDAAALPQLLKLAGSIVAPTTLLTALLFYFGRLHTYWFFRHFGLNFTVLDLSTQDYIIRSVDGLFVPMIVIALVGLVALTGLRALHVTLLRRGNVSLTRRVVLVVAAIGFILLTISIIALFRPDAFEATLGLPGLLLAAGVLLLAYAGRLLRRAAKASEPIARPPWLPVAEWGGVFLLVSIGLFWAVANYSASVGTSRALQTEALLAGEPSVVLFSAKSLSLAAPGVTEVACANPDAAYRFRYDGLKLVLRSGDQYVFLPAAWTPADGAAIIIPRVSSIRLEFSSPTTPLDPAC